MLLNHLKLSFRNLWKNRTLSFLNLLGLSIGIGSVLTLMFSVYAYYVADSMIPEQEHIYYLKTHLNDGNDYNEVVYPLLDKIKSTSPELKAGTHLHGWGDVWLEAGDKEFQNTTTYADSEFFKVFGLPLKYGNHNTAFKEKYSIVLTDKVSKQFFGEENPVGKSLKAADTLNLTITGVLEPISPYSSFRLGVLLPNTLLKDNPIFKQQTNWNNSFSPIFLKLNPETDIALFEKKVDKLVQENYADPSVISRMEVMPHSEVRMDSIPVVEIIIAGNIATSFFVLLLVLVNLLNLNTSTMFRRTKDIAVRKILGGNSKGVITQFCLENGILVLFSILISSVLFFGFLLPKMNDVFGADFGEINFSLKNDYPVILGAIALGILVTLVVGILPTIRFVSLPVSQGIKGKIDSAKGSFILRNSFIILQFSIAILFICIAIILNSQIGFMKKADLGFERDHVIVGNIDLDYKNMDAANSSFKALLNDLEANPYVAHVSTSQSVPSDYYFNYTTFYDPNTESDVRFRRSYTDDGYLKTLQIPLVEGRDFDSDIDNGEETPVIINRSAMEAFGWTTIEGKRLKYKNSDFIGNPIVGVMKDFHYQDLQNAVEPLVHYYRDEESLAKHRYITVRVVDGKEKEIKNIIAAAFAKIDSRKNYAQGDLSDKVSGQYRLIDGMLKTVNVVALLTIFISCLGMFGLISFMAKRRIKEIGIRKVLGAGVLKIVVLLSKDYIILVGIGALIAFPIAWYMMSAWLGSFAYSISIQWWMFALAGSIAFFITAFTLGIQAIKSAMANPVKSLRTE
ncbi:putative ABC transport system permease protein [Maribacter aquivivus]|uniref:Putative ABC transport system permease protein n=1 Tax=Maribacter aquivivus TaxID=228958 RepID=A0A1M6JD60_9FLAO|nr:ABC transporter permease [Maribacter aquivivus]SHJ44637.1 putative ABC transport system permease protein [Maribacter aquivivus]